MAKGTRKESKHETWGWRFTGRQSSMRAAVDPDDGHERANRRSSCFLNSTFADSNPSWQVDGRIFRFMDKEFAWSVVRVNVRLSSWNTLRDPGTRHETISQQIAVCNSPSKLRMLFEWLVGFKFVGWIRQNVSSQKGIGEKRMLLNSSISGGMTGGTGAQLLLLLLPACSAGKRGCDCSCFADSIEDGVLK